MPVTADGPAPYAPTAAVMDVVNGSRKRDFPTPLTTEVLGRAGVPDSLAPRTLQALKLLDLLDADGEPTEAWTDLAKAPESDFPDRFGAILRSAYQEVFQFVEPREDGIEKIQDAFRVYKPRGQLSRMVTLFLGLCAEAGIVEGKPTRKRPARKQQSTPSTAPARKPKHADPPGKTGLPRSPIEEDFQPSPPPASGQHPFIRGLIQTLPEVGTPWPTEAREKWAKAALAAFDVIYELPPDDRGGE